MAIKFLLNYLKETGIKKKWCCARQKPNNGRLRVLQKPFDSGRGNIKVKSSVVAHEKPFA